MSHAPTFGPSASAPPTADRRPLIAAALPETRFAGCPSWLAAIILAAITALCLYGLTPPARHAEAVSPSGQSDLKLYQAISARVAAGQSYYAAATQQHRESGYPLHPFVTVRLPTLALIQVSLGTRAALALLWGLTFAALTSLILRLRADLGPGRMAVYAAALAIVALAPTLAPPCLYWHEPWAAILMTLSLSIRSPARWLPSVALGLAAAAIRELALPYLCVMAVAAVLEGHRREAMAWAAAIAAFAILLAVHAHRLAGFVTPADLRSPGWNGFGGWHFILQMARGYTGLAPLPHPAIAVAVPLALLGWAAWRGPFGLRGALLLLGYACAFMLVGRADNDYWGMMMAPLLPIGLVFAPAAVRDLVRAVRASRPEAGNAVA